MSGPLLFALLMVLVLAFGVAMFWQESRRMQQSAAIYGVDDSVEWIWEGLGEDKLGLTKADVRRILEWEMHYLQQPDIWKDDGSPIVGGEAAAAYTQEKAFEEGYSYEPRQIYAVLDLQATYLEAIGAVGDPVEEDELPG
ncbi:MAG: hypothetical protein QNJ71_10805 [Acidimicrobiia bacterium]|nr:hypothetical protein [Acidimicrobiia bacterium]